MSDLTELLERVKAAKGPDRELDYAISRFADGELARHSSLHLPYTASIDAALALTERMLPGKYVMMGLWQTENTKPWARIGNWNQADAVGANLPLAILAALLTALSLDTKEQP